MSSFDLLNETSGDAATRVVWYETRQGRDSKHTTGRCPSRDWKTFDIECANECKNLFDAVFDHARKKFDLRAEQASEAEVEAPLAYLRQIVANKLIDLHQKDNVLRGAPARPVRDTGRPGQLHVVLKAVEDGWLSEVFRQLQIGVDRGRTQWPLAELRDEKASYRKLTPLEISDLELVRDIERVRGFALELLGPQFWDDNVLMPMRRMSAPPAQPAGDRTVWDEYDIEAFREADQQDNLETLALLKAEYDAQRRRGLEPIAAIKEALYAVTGAVPTGPGTAKHFRESAEDLERLRLEPLAKQSLSDMLRGTASIPSDELLADLALPYEHHRKKSGHDPQTAARLSAWALLGGAGQPSGLPANVLDTLAEALELRSGGY